MSQSQTIEQAPTAAQTKSARLAGAEGGGGAEHLQEAASAPVLTIEEFRAIAQAMFGTIWKTEIAKMTGFSKSYITHILSANRPMAPDMAKRLRIVAIKRIQANAAVLSMAGMPLATAAHTKAAKRLIKHATAVAEDPAKFPALQAIVAG